MRCRGGWKSDGNRTGKTDRNRRPLFSMELMGSKVHDGRKISQTDHGYASFSARLVLKDRKNSSEGDVPC
jgi:hypothetical protein